MIRICHFGDAGVRPPTDALVDRCARLGFDTIGLSLPALLGDAAPDRPQAAAAALEPIRSRGLGGMVDLRLDRLAADVAIVREQPAWFQPVRDGDVLPDPRNEPEPARHALARFEGGAAAPLLDWWQSVLASWCEAGVSAFRCLSPQRLPARGWRRLIDGVRSAHPQARFFAWTPGLAPAESEALAGSGFDGCFGSLPWWDYRASWFFDEHARLRRIGPVLAATADPRAPDEAPVGLAAGRRIRVAAELGEGLLVTPALLQPDATDPEALREALARQASPAPAMRRLVPLIAGGAPVAAIRIHDTPDAAAASGNDAAQDTVLLVNAHDSQVAEIDVGAVLAACGGSELIAADGPGEEGDKAAAAHGIGDCLALEPGEVRRCRTPRAAPMRSRQRALKAIDAAQADRVMIEDLRPQIDGGRFPIKRVVGDTIVVEADVFSDGHGLLGAALRWRAEDTGTWQEVAMRPLGNDRWRAEFPVLREGVFLYTVIGWRDEFGTLFADLEKKRAAGVVTDGEVAEAAVMVAEAGGRCRGNAAKALRAVTKSVEKAPSRDEKLAVLLSPATAAAMAQPELRRFVAAHPAELRVNVERIGARFSSWYELFPRSQSGSTDRHGTFDDVIARLPAIRDMGFDVLYMPPIHPIGMRNRKGRNNTLTAEAGDPGSPYAIGSEEGGHDAIHPELGTLEDFRRLVAAARAHELEVALDFAIQCSPDHPWLREHPDWFAWRPDGSIRYAENPPKKYQDIVNVEFYAEGAVPGLWNALRDVVLFWVEQGVHLFRVDNPHTKPLPFWEWLIAEVRRVEPRAVFLSEAFTRPKLMNRLAKLGFSQSYTYFTWRNDKHELTEYLTQLNTGDVAEYFRPHFFVNTPDINPVFLQHSGRPGHLIRAALATTLSGLWGMYQGFELCEATPLPGKEEYLDSEKYEIRAWDWQRPGNIVAEITRLNGLRRCNPELQSHLGVAFHQCDNDRILYFAKRGRSSGTMVLVAVSLDPAAPQSGTFEVPLWEFGLPDHASVEVSDLWTHRQFAWHGKHQRVELTPERPFSIWRISRPVAA